MTIMLHIIIIIITIIIIIINNNNNKCNEHEHLDSVSINKINLSHFVLCNCNCTVCLWPIKIELSNYRFVFNRFINLARSNLHY